MIYSITPDSPAEIKADGLSKVMKSGATIHWYFVPAKGRCETACFAGGRAQGCNGGRSWVAIKVMKSLKKEPRMHHTRHMCKQANTCGSSILWTSPLPLADFNGRFPDFEIYYTIFSWLPPVFPYTKACPHPNLPFVICLILVDRWIKQYVYTVAQRRGSNCYDVRCNRPFRTPPNKCHGSKCHAWEMVLSILAAMAIASHNYRRLCQQIPVSVVSVRPCSTFSFQGARRCINILTTSVSILSTVRWCTVQRIRRSQLLLPY